MNFFQSFSQDIFLHFGRSTGTSYFVMGVAGICSGNGEVFFFLNFRSGLADILFMTRLYEAH